MKAYKILLAVSFLVIIMIIIITTFSQRKPENVSEKGVVWYKRESAGFVVTAIRLRNAFSNISANDKNSIIAAKTAFIKCRLQYKHIAFFMEYFFPEGAIICNGPPVQEVESDEEFREPAGLQVIESLLYAENPHQNKEKLMEQATLLVRTVQSFSPLLDDFKTEDHDLLTSLNIELTRIITLYITGYDAPQIKTGIEESYESLSTINILLDPYLKDYEQKDSITHYLTGGKQYLKTHTDFDSFDRLFFITHYALPIEKQLNRLINKINPNAHTTSVFNTNAKDLFAPHAINKDAFPHTEDENDTSIASLGKQLFFNSALSGNNIRTCATCHSPSSFFTDNMSRNRTMDGTSDLPRNTPSLLYTCYQYAQFWDGRAESLEDQIRAVLKSKLEMNALEDTIIKRLSNDPAYIQKFKKIWAKGPSVNLSHTVGALAAFIRTLAPFQSAFDHYIQGDQTALSVSQKRGFNLFMGKAQCGTCHFAPIFNGLLPPDYKITEFEILGTTADDDFEKPHIDSDQGRYDFVPFALNKGAFKTPSIRNAAMTAPYMHNGKFNSLEKVIDFYDQGGGSGLGLNVPEQTLSSSPLHLNTQEKKDIIAFIEALTDK